MVTGPQSGGLEKDTFADLVLMLKSIPKLENPRLENPSVTELLGLSEEDLGSVWDRFQFSISKRNIYSQNSGDISQLLKKMQTLPIVGM